MNETLLQTQCRFYRAFLFKTIMEFTKEELENEIWIHIPNWEDFYQVSDLGRVRRLDYSGFTKTGNKHFYRGCILKQDCRGGKCYITLRQGNLKQRYSVTELIFNIFYPEVYETSFIYLDYNPKNNKLINIAVLSDNYKQCRCCKVSKLINEFYESNNKISTNCKECTIVKSTIREKENPELLREYRKKYAEENKESILDNRRVYRKNNREYFREYARNYQVRKRLEDNLFRVKHNVRNRLWCAFKNNNWKKEGSVKLLGAEYETVMTYLESLFVDHMSWDNYGRCVDGDCTNYWHIDHKIPLNTANTKEEMEVLCHYTNLQPLWAVDNLTKPKK